ncbi:MAG: hypothetical protein AAF196_10505 [Planctomycetota bacterium]
MLEHQAFLGTFHKTGTTLMRKIVEPFAKKNGLKFWIMHEQETEPQSWELCFHYHSKFLYMPEFMDDSQPRRYVVTIRDPRDVVVSCTKYHLDSEEEWLHVPDDRFGGKTYQQHLNSLETTAERQVFELENVAGGILNQLRNLDASDERLLLVKLEDLMTDFDLMHFHRLFSHLGFEGDAIPKLLELSYKNSVFAKNFAGSRHIRSGRTRLWETELSSEAATILDERYAGLVEQLGYE